MTQTHGGVDQILLLAGAAAGVPDVLPLRMTTSLPGSVAGAVGSDAVVGDSACAGSATDADPAVPECGAEASAVAAADTVVAVAAAPGARQRRRIDHDHRRRQR